MFGSSKKAGAVTVIGRQAVFRGSLQLKGTLQIDGRVEGDVDVEGDISIGPQGVVTGDLQADRLTVSGRVDGQVRVLGLLKIQKGGSVADSVLYGSLEVEKGGSLQGHSGSINDSERTSRAKALPHGTEPHGVEPPNLEADGAEREEDYDDSGYEGEEGRPPALGHA